MGRNLLKHVKLMCIIADCKVSILCRQQMCRKGLSIEKIVIRGDIRYSATYHGIAKWQGIRPVISRMHVYASLSFAVETNVHSTHDIDQCQWQKRYISVSTCPFHPGVGIIIIIFFNGLWSNLCEFESMKYGDSLRKISTNKNDTAIKININKTQKSTLFIYATSAMYIV